MPYETELTDDCMGVVHTGRGVVTGNEILRGSFAVTQLVQNTENFHYEFVDLSEATGISISDSQLQQIAALDRMTAFFRPHAVVVVVAPDDRLFAVAQRWEGLVRSFGWNTHLSRSRSEAKQWLKENFDPQQSQLTSHPAHP
ncbi:MAG TPA: hypothetical protein VGL24_10645 [Chthoniobacterales bacterium]